MLASIPVVASKIAGFDILIDEETSLLVEREWKEPVERVLADRTLAAKLGKNASALIADKYTSATQIAAFEASFILF